MGVTDHVASCLPAGYKLRLVYMMQAVAGRESGDVLGL